MRSSRRRFWIVFAWLCLAGTLAGIVPAHAANKPISVTIDGGGGGGSPQNPLQANCNTPSTPPYCVNLGGTYVYFQIDPTFVGNGESAYARVRVPVAEGTQDTLEITNTRITNNDMATARTISIIFEREDIQMPATLKWYNTFPIGNFGPANGNSITITPSYKLSGGAYQTAGTVQTYTVSGCPSTCNTSIPANKKTGKQFNPVTNVRWVKIQLDITLQPGSFVDLNSGVKIMTSSNPPDEPTTDPVSSFCMTTQSTAKAFGCPSCVTQDGQVAEHAKVKLFASTNWDNLSQDMARGQGEHLTSLATLLKIQANRQFEFFELAQEKHRTSTGSETPEQVVASLYETWSSH